MARITAVIDIGSNSARMVVFERTSRFGFYLLKEIKSKVRISEGAYENGGALQPKAMERAVSAIKEFLSIANSYKARKILCVATSAVRDAPNKSEFLARVRRDTGLNIKVIDGSKEAYYGAVAALNMLKIEDAITVDIGGGSTEMALIKNGKIEDLISLNLGTVRLKELVFDKNLPLDEAIKFVKSELEKAPSHFKAKTIIGIGGTNRALSNAIMAMTDYPVDTLHGFEFSLYENLHFFDALIASKVGKLKNFKIKPERYDVIREGALIIRYIIDKINADKMIASGVGVREGVFLADLLRNQNNKFPKNFSPSLRSLLDRFGPDEYAAKQLTQTAKKLFTALKDVHKLDEKWLWYLSNAAKLLNIGVYLNFYSHRHHSYYMILNNLDYGFTHIDKLVIASIVKYHGKKFSTLEKDSFYNMLKPYEEIIKWLSTILSIAEALTIDKSKQKLDISYKKGCIEIKSDKKMHLAHEKLKLLLKGSGLNFCIVKMAAM